MVGRSVGLLNQGFQWALFNTPWGIVPSLNGKLLYVADSSNNVIRALDLTTRKSLLCDAAATVFVFVDSVLLARLSLMLLKPLPPWQRLQYLDFRVWWDCWCH